jgi:hypothetical protein
MDPNNPNGPYNTFQPVMELNLPPPPTAHDIYPVNHYQQYGQGYPDPSMVGYGLPQHPNMYPIAPPTTVYIQEDINSAAAEYPSPAFSSEIRECDILEQEISESPEFKESKSIKFKNKLILFFNDADVDLFYKISKFARDNPDSNRKMALDTFLHNDHSDALINIIYEHTVEAVMIYTTKVKEKSKAPTHRADFIIQLLKKGLILVLEISKIKQEERVLLVYTSFETMAMQAELQKFRFQLGVEAIKRHIPDFGQLSEAHSSVTQTPMRFLTDMVVHFSSDKRSVPFEYEKLADFKEGDMDRFGSRVKEYFFSPENRIQLTHSIITSAYIRFKHSSSRRSSIRELIDLKVFIDYYFLHEHHPLGYSSGVDDLREKLELWSKKLSIHGLPLIELRKYFGENIAFYFAWLDFYTKWFKSLSAIGLISFLYGFFKFVSRRNTPAALIFDSEATAYFALCISIWSIFFLKFWKRKASHLQFVWDMDNLDKSEQIRVEWRATTKRVSPVTGKPELYESLLIRESRRTLAGTIMVIASLGLCGLIAANLAFTGYLFNSNVIPGNVSGVIGTSLFTILQIGLVAPLYGMLVVALNNFENYKTQTEYLGNLVGKQFIMYFVNSFGLLYFTSMIKPVTDELIPNVKMFGYYVTECVKNAGYSSCFTETTLSIAIVFGGQQYLNTGFQLVYPFVVSWWGKRSTRKKDVDEENKPSLPYYLKEFFLAPVTLDVLSTEYSTKVIQLGYVLLFSSPFPLAPILAWFNNIVEIRVDLYKFLKLYRRPFVENADAIGAWQKIITMIVFLSTVSNSVIIAFTSISLEEYFLQYTQNLVAWKLGFVILFEVLIYLRSICCCFFLYFWTM